MFYIYWMQWSLLYFVQIKIMCSVQIYLFCTFFIHTYLFLNYYKTIALTTGQIIAKSSCSCSIKGTGQRWGDRSASRGTAGIEGTGQRRWEPASWDRHHGAAAGSTNKPEPEKKQHITNFIRFIILPVVSERCFTGEDLDWTDLPSAAEV